MTNVPGAEAQRQWRTVAVMGVVVLAMVAAGWFILIKQDPAGEASPGGVQAPPPEVAEEREWEAVIHTSGGPLAITLAGGLAPQAVANFVTLARDGFFDGTECHRLLPAALLQCGDPDGTGRGGPGYSFGPVENAPADQIYRAGTVAMARIGGDGHSMGSQFFLVFDDILLPDDRAGGYSVIGTLTSGLELLHNIGEAGTVDGSMDGRPSTSVIIESVEVT